jgi:hypothetical protein
VWHGGPFVNPSASSFVTSPYQVYPITLTDADPTLPLDESDQEVAETQDVPILDTVYGILPEDNPWPASAQLSILLDELEAFYQKTLMVFRFKTRLKALELQLGQTITIDYAEEGFKLYTSSDPQSPDNTASFNAQKATVIGIAYDPNTSGDAYPVTLTVFRQEPGYYPAADLT